jgi:MFS family permease
MRTTLVRQLGLGLSREIWIVELGVLLNMLGYGAVFPFEVIYLHSARGFSLSTAGLVVGVLTGGSVVTAPIAGVVIDRFGARFTVVTAGVALASGYAVLGLARVPLVAFVGAALAAAGNGALNPAQSALMAVLAPNETRHRVTAVSRVIVNFSIGLGAAIGGLVAGYGLRGFETLFFANGLTYLLYVMILAVAVRDEVSGARAHTSGGYRAVLRDRVFMHLALTNVAMIAVGWGVFSWVVPVYAKSILGFDTRRVGFILLANAATVVLAQLPIVRLGEGRSRALALVVGCLTWVAACVLVIAAHDLGSASYLALVVAAMLFALGECFYSVALAPLVAQLAPPALRGRYMATIGLAWWIGLAIGSTGTLQILSRSPNGGFVVAAGVAAAAALSILALERRIPAEARLTPRAVSREREIETSAVSEGSA